MYGWPSLATAGLLMLRRSYDEEKLSDAVLERCGAHAGILHIGTTPDAPVNSVAACRHNHGVSRNRTAVTFSNNYNNFGSVSVDFGMKNRH